MESAKRIWSVLVTREYRTPGLRRWYICSIAVSFVICYFVREEESLGRLGEGRRKSGVREGEIITPMMQIEDNLAPHLKV